MNQTQKERLQALIRQLLGSQGPGERVYQDEPILRRASELRSPKPRPEGASPIRKMRKLCTSYGYFARMDAKLFLRQARFMADYEDDLPWEGPCELYYPSYESMTDRQLRGYFTWRSWVRAGRIESAPRGFVQVYCFELISLIGVDGPQAAYEKLAQLLAFYREGDLLLEGQIRRWLHDFVIWYGLDPSCLPGGQAQSDFEGHILTLLNYRQRPHQELCQALALLSSYRLENARFYKLHPEEVSEVVWRVFDQLTAFHEKHRKTSFCEALIGRHFQSPYHMFPSALMDLPPHPDADYQVSALNHFQCRSGSWTQKRFFAHSGKSKSAGVLLRQIDYCLRQAYGFHSTLKPGEVTKTYQAVIDKVIAAFLAEQEQKARQAQRQSVRIDLGKLDGIRSAALVTQQSLIVEEGPDDAAAPTEPVSDPTAAPAEPVSDPAAAPAEPDPETRLLRCLLSGQPYGWVRSQGLLLSVLVEQINERYYDRFADTVVDWEGDAPVLVEDYVNDLKEIIGP